MCPFVQTHRLRIQKGFQEFSLGSQCQPPFRCTALCHCGNERMAVAVPRAHGAEVKGRGGAKEREGWKGGSQSVGDAI